jgi:hypothetical protein
MSAGCHIREVFSCKKTLFTGPVPVKKTLSCIPVRIWGKFFSCPVFLYDFSVQAKKSCPCSCSCKQDAEPRTARRSKEHILEIIEEADEIKRRLQKQKNKRHESVNRSSGNLPLVITKLLFFKAPKKMSTARF